MILVHTCCLLFLKHPGSFFIELQGAHDQIHQTGLQVSGLWVGPRTPLPTPSLMQCNFGQVVFNPPSASDSHLHGECALFSIHLEGFLPCRLFRNVRADSVLGHFVISLA